MSFLSERMAIGHSFMEDFDPAEIKYLGNTWIGLSSQIERRRGGRQSGGQFAEQTGSVSIRVEIMGGVTIKSGKEILVDGVRFWTGVTRTDGTSVEVDLMSSNKAAPE